LAKELAEIGYPITNEEMIEAKDRIKDRTIRAGRARRMDRMSVCNRCRSSIFAESVYCSHCGDLVGKAPTRSVFVSYGSQDGQFVESIINSLRKRNISAWFDEWELLPGMSIQDEINKAIDRSKIFLFFASSSTLVKKWPKEELKAALNRRMNAANDLIIIPILLDECQNQLPTLLKDTKYLVFFDGKERINIEKENGKKLLDSLEKAILHLGKDKVLAG
jgi:hypothetical protein